MHGDVGLPRPPRRCPRPRWCVRRLRGRLVGGLRRSVLLVGVVLVGMVLVGVVLVGVVGMLPLRWMGVLLVGVLVCLRLSHRR